MEPPHTDNKTAKVGPVCHQSRAWRDGVSKLSWIKPEPKGFRDIYWCPYMNEPVVLKYRNGTNDKYCELCDSGLDHHIFICHINPHTENEDGNLMERVHEES
jgi:hypothetical protein